MSGATSPIPDAGRPAQRKFGTFLGVFTPSVLTILGVIMYLRFGWVVANAGLGGALAIVTICMAIALVTALSASAVATNMALGTGGEYYLISRSLGITIGGAIGIPLALCRILSVTLYCFGLAEAMGMLWPAEWGAYPLSWIAGGLIAVITLISGKSAAASLKLQVPLMVLVGLSLLALAAGVATGSLHGPRWLAPQQVGGAAPAGFWAVLAVFFPAVTGFAAGIGMSGDLEDPQRSIPRGTLLAVAVGAAVYLSVPFLLAVTGRVTPGRLAGIDPADPPVWTRIALLGGWLVLPGMWAAILSSAFGSTLAGPRVMQALSQDGLAPKLLGRSSATGQPTVATWVAGAIALAAVALGDLNAVAKLVTIFFLTLYMSINFVAAIESLVGDPSYRPTLRVHWSISLLGAAGNLVVMFLISPGAGAVAIALQLGLFLLLRRRDLKAGWGDVWAGLWGTVARFCLHKLRRQRQDPRSWRPNTLLFADRIEQRAGIVRLAASFNQNHGVLTVCDVLVGRPDDEVAAAAERENAVNGFLRREGILAFGEVTITERFVPGVLDAVQANGIGPLRPNTIVFGWPPRVERLAETLAVLRTLGRLGKASMILRPVPPGGPERCERIDVWWRGRQNNGDLMLLLAHLLRLSPRWRRSRITVRSIVTSQAGRSDMDRSLAALIESVRIKADRDVIVKPPGKSVLEIMHETSGAADVAFLGLMIPEPGEEGAYARRLTEMLAGLPTTVLVRNDGPFRGQLLA